MNPAEFRVDPDVHVARTPPAALYGDPAWFAAVADRVLARGWHVVADAGAVAVKETACPVTLLPGVLDEPLVVTRDRTGGLHCLSNACTHRGNTVATECGPAKLLTCRYHGRTFRLDGGFMGMPGMEGAPGFPSPSDSLQRVPVAAWGPCVFASLAPSTPFEALVGPLRERCGFAEVPMRLDVADSRDYEIDANWALYVDNYLEGFHVRFVHPELSEALDLPKYANETFPHAVLQLGVAAPGEPAFDPPPGHVDHGRSIAAYWWWLFPATMLNLYPWGLSVNIVEPLSPTRTRIRFLTYVADESTRGRGAGGDLHRVELQDEAVVQQVQRGMKSRLWKPGRYSPHHERGVHHFHRMLADALASSEER
jgi:choline monooxygenase